ncbi:S1 RNA-binding domain-containing protein [Kitasatospora sp. NPDC002040]|uniref:S1 RNA-binding domain-containing protein n=1 Tax=Kitasatospora sp. NPDC002040 TaxID=3154661 RepID=UPI0033293722
MALPVHRVTPGLRCGGRRQFAAAAVSLVAASAEAAGVHRLVIDNPMLEGFFSYGARGGAGRMLSGLFPDRLAGCHDGAVVPLATGLELVRIMLVREGSWCRLRSDSGFSVHVGDQDDLYLRGELPVPDEDLRIEAVGSSPYDPGLDEVQQRRPADGAFWRELGLLVAESGPVLVEEQYIARARRWHRPTGADELAVLRGGLAPRARVRVWPDLTGDIGAVRAAVLRGERLELLVQQAPDGRLTDGRIAEPWMGRSDAPHPQIADGPGHRATLIPWGSDGPGPLLDAQLPDADGVLRARWRTNRTLADRRRAFLGSLRVGDTVTGTVATGLEDVGVRVDLDGEPDRGLGFLRVPELSWERVDSVDVVAPIGRRIRARILHVDWTWEEVSLSVKALTPDPWRTPGRLPASGAAVRGTVSRVLPFGVFVRLAEGVEGMVHAPEAAVAVAMGDEVEVVVLDVDLMRRRIGLAFRPGSAQAGG